MSNNENLIITPDSHRAFERSIEMLSHSLREIRQVAMQMIPETIMLHGLDTSLREYIDQVQKPEGLRIVYESFGMKDVVLEPARAAAIFHVIQELVNNTIRHAGAEKLVIMISNRNGRVWINVEDNGHGFDTDILRQHRGSGWSQILQSMEEMQGKIETQSAPGRGTSVRLVFDDK